MILSAQSIRKREGMVTPFEEKTIFNGMSFGLTGAGYDIRIAQDSVVPVGKGVLASSFEHFRLPDDIQGRVCDKSSWARKMLAVQNTVLEPGWYGYLTLELTNHSDKPITILKGSPIAQVVFHLLDEPTELPYTGKYQAQKEGPQPAIEEKDRNQEAADREAERHPEWWNLDIARLLDQRRGEDFIVLRLPPFDTFAFDRVAAVLDFLFLRGKYDNGECRLSLKQYVIAHEKLEEQGFRVPPLSGNLQMLKTDEYSFKAYYNTTGITDINAPENRPFFAFLKANNIGFIQSWQGRREGFVEISNEHREKVKAWKPEPPVL